MTSDELACFRRQLSSVRKYLEFGSGGSTSLAVEEGIPEIWSVESDANWVSKLKAEEHIRRAVKQRKLRFIVPKIGETARWGEPTDESTRFAWHRYHSGVWQRLDPLQLDLVLVDGRFRVACALQAALRTNDKCKILVHDFWNRSRYHVVTQFLTEVERVDSLAVFVPKRPLDIGKTLNCLFKYLLRPD